MSDLKTAEQHYGRALVLDPADSGAKTGLAEVLRSTDGTDEAISVLEAAAKDDPTNTAAHYRLSALYRRADRTADSEREMAAYKRYKELKDKVDKTYRQLVGAVRKK